MPAPAIYTEVSLAAYMHDVLALTAPLLSLTLTGNGGVGSYVETVNDVVLAYHGNATGTIAEADNIIKLRALAKREAWRLAAGRAAALYDAASEDQRAEFSQLHKQALAQLELATKAADAIINPPSSGGSSGAPRATSGAVRTVVDW